MIEGPVPALGKWSVVAMMGIEVVIHVAMKIMGAVKPRAGSEEHASAEPFGAVVPVGRAMVRREVIVAIWAQRFWSDLNCNLSGYRTRDA